MLKENAVKVNVVDYCNAFELLNSLQVKSTCFNFISYEVLINKSAYLILTKLSMLSELALI